MLDLDKTRLFEDDDEMTKWFIQDDGKKYNKKAHLEKENKRSTLYRFPLMKRIKLCTMKTYEIEHQVTIYENMN